MKNWGTESKASVVCVAVTDAHLVYLSASFGSCCARSIASMLCTLQPSDAYGNRWFSLEKQAHKVMCWTWRPPLIPTWFLLGWSLFHRANLWLLFQWEPVVSSWQMPIGPKRIGHIRRQDTPRICSSPTLQLVLLLHLTGSSGQVYNGNDQRRRSHHRRRQAVAGSRAASAEGDQGREAEVRLLQGRQGGGRQGRAAARGGDRGGDGGVPGAGAGGRADVDGGHRAEPGAEQQPAGVDPAGRVRPHLVPLHRLLLHPRRRRRVRRPLALKSQHHHHHYLLLLPNLPA